MRRKNYENYIQFFTNQFINTMRKITSLLMLLLMCVGTAVAQITTLPTDGDMCYNIKTADRGWWCVTSAATGATSTTKANLATMSTDKKQLFQFKTVGSSTYLYSTFKKQYVKSSGNTTVFTNEPEEPITLLSSGNSSFPTVIKFETSGNMAGISNGYDPAIWVGWNYTSDGGNQCAIVAVGTEEDIDNAITVTYNVLVDGNIVATQSGVTAIAGTAPQIPSALDNAYCTFTYDVETLTTTTTVVNATAVPGPSLPFQISTSFADAKWYVMSIRSKWITYGDSKPYQCVASYDLTNQNQQWAFFGNPYTGIKIMNKAAGDGLYLSYDNAANQEQPYMTSTAKAWLISKNSGGFVFRMPEDNTIYMHNRGTNLSTCSVAEWSGVHNDAGSTLAVVEVPSAFGNVTYNVYDNGSVIATSTQENVGVGEQINSIPSSLLSTAMVGGLYSYTFTPITVAAGDNEVIVNRSAVSNDKSYTITSSRGKLGVRDNRLASTYNGASVTDDKFAIINYEGNYYLWSIADNAFIVGNSGNEVESQDPSASYNFTTTSFPYLLKQGSYGVNITGTSNNYQVVINTWATPDGGNCYEIAEAGTFDPTNALALLNAYFHTADKTAEVIAEIYPYIFADPANPTTSDPAASVGQPFGVTAEVASNFVSTYGTNIVNNSFSAEEYEAAKAMILAGVATPADGFYLVKNVSTGKYFRATGLGDRTKVVADVTDPSTDAAAIIEVRTVGGNQYMLSNTGWINWIYSTGYGAGASQNQDKYVHWYAQAPGKGSFGIALGNGEGTYEAYLNDGYYASNADGSTFGAKLENAASVWEFIPVTSLTINLNTVEGKGYATTYLPFAVRFDASEVVPYTVRENTAGDMAIYTSIDSNEVPAGTGVLLISETGATSATATIISSAEAVENNELTGHYFAGEVASALVLNAVGGQVGFYSLAAGSSLAANRAFLGNDGGSIRGLQLVAAGAATGIQNVETKAAQNAKVFDLQGRRVQNAQKGLYIVNGKKVIL